MAAESMSDDGGVFRKRVPLYPGDVDPGGWLRPDSVARLGQDVAIDHLRHVGADREHPVWVLRRLRMTMEHPVVDSREIELTRWTTGVAEKWCSVEVDLAGDDGGFVRTEGFWIHVDPERGPAPISPEFREYLGQTAEEGRLRWRSSMPRGHVDFVEQDQIALRPGDFDRLGHVNNAVYWSFLTRWWPRLRAGATVALEFDQQITPDVFEVRVESAEVDGATLIRVTEPSSDARFARALVTG